MKKIIWTVIISVAILALYIFWGGGKLTDISVNNKIEKLKVLSATNNNKDFNYSNLNGLPPLLAKYFRSVIRDSIVVPNFAAVAQIAEIKTGKTSAWYPMESQEFLTTQLPNYLWVAEVRKSKFLWVKTIDGYINGKGNMTIKINSSIKISDAENVEINKSGLFKYFSDALMFPTALMPSNSLLWNILDSNTAEIKFKDKGNAVVAKVFFNKNGLIEKITTEDKYRSTGKGYVRTPYTIYYSNYKWFYNKFYVPTHFEYEWKLPDGIFRYAKFDIVKIHYE